MVSTTHILEAQGQAAALDRLTISVVRSRSKEVTLPFLVRAVVRPGTVSPFCKLDVAVLWRVF